MFNYPGGSPLSQSRFVFLALLSAALMLPQPAPAQRTVVVRGMDYAYQAPDTVAAGPVTFVFENVGTVRHELVIARLKSGHTLGDVIAAKTVEERRSHFDVIFGLLVAEPGQPAPARLLTELTKGETYALICNLRDAPDRPVHLAQGMGHMLHVR